jgi:hypothetical protein
MGTCRPARLPRAARSSISRAVTAACRPAGSGGFDAPLRSASCLQPTHCLLAIGSDVCHVGGYMACPATAPASFLLTGSAAQHAAPATNQVRWRMRLRSQAAALLEALAFAVCPIGTARVDLMIPSQVMRFFVLPASISSKVRRSDMCYREGVTQICAPPAGMACRKPAKACSCTSGSGLPTHRLEIVITAERRSLDGPGSAGRPMSQRWADGCQQVGRQARAVGQAAGRIQRDPSEACSGTWAGMQGDGIRSDADCG